MTSYLASVEATHSNDAEDVKDGGAHDGPHTNVTFGDEHPWGKNDVRQCVVHYLTYAAAGTAAAVLTNRYHRTIKAWWSLESRHHTQTLK